MFKQGDQEEDLLMYLVWERMIGKAVREARMDSSSGKQILRCYDDMRGP